MIVHSPTPLVKIIIIGILFFLSHLKQFNKEILLSFGPESVLDGSGWVGYYYQNSLGFSLSNGQQLLFCCFANVLVLHLPSFIWSYRVNLTQSIRLLEHILHYYFTQALILLMLHMPLHVNGEPIGSIFNELIISSQMCFYFLWHIFHEMKTNNHHTFKKHCTVFPNCIEMSIYLFITCIIPIFWASLSEHQETKPFYYHNDSRDEISKILLQFLYLYSMFLIPEVGSLMFQLSENIYSHILNSGQAKTVQSGLNTF